LKGEKNRRGLERKKEEIIEGKRNGRKEEEEEKEERKGTEAPSKELLEGFDIIFICPKRRWTRFKIPLINGRANLEKQR